MKTRLPVEVKISLADGLIELIEERMGAVVQETINSAPVRGYYNPKIVSFRTVAKTNCPLELQEQLEGTVAWDVSMFEGRSVVDKLGVTHYPIPLRAFPVEVS